MTVLTPVDLSNVSLAPRAVVAWRRMCRDVMRSLSLAIDPATVLNEEAELMPASGRLRVFVRHPAQKGRVLAAMVLPPEHWHWRH